MAKYNIPGLRQQRNAWFWEPSATLAREGWQRLTLGTDEAAAIVKAAQRVAEVQAWRAKGRPPLGKDGLVKTPKQSLEDLRAPIVAGRGITLARLIREYQIAGYPRADDEHDAVADGTRRNYDIAFDKLVAWGGGQPANLVTPDSARKFIRVLVEKRSKGTGYAVLAAAKRVYSFGIDTPRLGITESPFARVKFSKPKPRKKVWDEGRTGDDYDLFADAAEAVGKPELALAVDLFLMLGQRTIDMVKVSADDWRPIEGLDPYQAERLANHDGPNAGEVMGFHLFTQKTQTWVTIPVGGAKRRRVEAQIAKNAARLPVVGRRGRPRSTRVPDRRDPGVTPGALLVNEHTGVAWHPGSLQGWFREARAHAVEVLGLPQFAGIQLRDLRRTCVVRMAEAGRTIPEICAITGHSLATATQILETYMPRNVHMAAAAVVAMMDHDERRDKRARKARVKLVHSA